ncbi:hypothetical protein ACOSP7_015432 [Xanthoceras sorbifolium]
MHGQWYLLKELEKKERERDFRLQRKCMYRDEFKTLIITAYKLLLMVLPLNVILVGCGPMVLSHCYVLVSSNPEISIEAAGSNCDLG